MKYKFRNSKKTWRVSWMIGIIFIILSLVSNRHYYFFYYYFFVVGIISYLKMGSKYASISDSELIIFFGRLFNRKSIKLLWEDISSIQETKRLKSDIYTVGGWVRFTINRDVEVKIAEIELKKTIPRNIMKTIAHQKYGIDVGNDGKSILLLNPPEYGYGEFKNVINFFLNKQENGENSFKFRRLTFILDWTIIVFSVILMLINLLKYNFNFRIL